MLAENGLLEPGDYQNINWGNDPSRINYELLFNYRYKILKKAFGHYDREDVDFQKFLKKKEYQDFGVFMNITLPYMMFVMTPSLITTFIGNLNNFNIIYLLTGGGPNLDPNMTSTAGQTDLLITWLYKLTVNDQSYDMASVIGILVFVICAIVSLIFYSTSNSFKNEEDFQ